MTSRASEYFREHLSFAPGGDLPQRRLVDLGRALGRIISMEWVIELGDMGFRSDLITNSLAVLRTEISGLLASFNLGHGVVAVEEYAENSSWLAFSSPNPA